MPGPWWRSGRAILLLGLSLPVLPFLVSSGFPSQDGPAHAETAQLLALIRAGEAPVAAGYLEEFDPGLTNVLAPWVLSLLLRVMPAARAEWALALGLTLLLAGAVLLSLRLLRGRAEDVALGALLCAPLMLYMGSFSLVLGMACGFVGLACAARYLAGGRSAFALLFLLATLLGCVANVQVAVPVLAAAFGGVAGASLWRRLRGGRLVLARAEVTLLAAALPVAGLALLYRLRMAEAEVSGGAPRWELRRQVAALLFRGDIAWFWYSDLVLLLALNAVLGAAALWWLWRGARGPATADAPGGMAAAAPWALAGGLAIAAAMLVLPLDTTAVPQIPMRLGPFLQFLLFLWFVAAALPVGWRRAVVALALAAGLSQAVTRSLGHRVLEERLAEMAGIEARIPDGAVTDIVRIAWLAANPVAPHDTPAHHIGGFRIRFSPFMHAGRGFGGRDIVNFGNYQFRPHWWFFRLRPRPALRGVPGLGWLDWSLHRGSIPGGFSGYLAQLRSVAGRDLDYLIVWNSGVDAAARAQRDPRLAAFLRELEAGFEPVGRSAPAGLAELWRRRQAGPERDAPPLAGLPPR